MTDAEYDAWLAERGWRRGRESANGEKWQATADNGYGTLGDLGSYSNGDTGTSGYGPTLADARAAVRRLVEEREAWRKPPA